jgi:hypothetical protein
MMCPTAPFSVLVQRLIKSLKVSVYLIKSFHICTALHLTRSTCWEPELLKHSWGLSAEEAAAIADALLEDLSLYPH